MHKLSFDMKFVICFHQNYFKHIWNIMNVHLNHLHMLLVFPREQTFNTNIGCGLNKIEFKDPKKNITFKLKNWYFPSSISFFGSALKGGEKHTHTHTHTHAYTRSRIRVERGREIEKKKWGKLKCTESWRLLSLV
jgi:hypothetical protein